MFCRGCVIKLQMLYCRPEITESQMMEGFHSMIDRYNEQRRQLRNRRPWVDSSKKPGVPPSVMTVTHVNQTKDLYVCYIICSLIFCFITWGGSNFTHLFTNSRRAVKRLCVMCVCYSLLPFSFSLLALLHNSASIQCTCTTFDANNQYTSENF